MSIKTSVTGTKIVGVSKHIEARSLGLLRYFRRNLERVIGSLVKQCVRLDGNCVYGLNLTIEPWFGDQRKVAIHAEDDCAELELVF